MFSNFFLHTVSEGQCVLCLQQLSWDQSQFKHSTNILWRNYIKPQFFYENQILWNLDFVSVSNKILIYNCLGLIQKLWRHSEMPYTQHLCHTPLSLRVNALLDFLDFTLVFVLFLELCQESYIILVIRSPYGLLGYDSF